MLFISLSVLQFFIYVHFLQGKFSHRYRLLSTKVIVLSVKKKIIPNWNKTKTYAFRTENMEDWFPSTKKTNKQTKKQNK